MRSSQRRLGRRLSNLLIRRARRTPALDCKTTSGDLPKYLPKKMHLMARWFLLVHLLASNRKSKNQSEVSLGKQLGRKVAERGGFEPPIQFYPYNGLANRRFRPLSHLSIQRTSDHRLYPLSGKQFLSSNFGGPHFQGAMFWLRNHCTASSRACRGGVWGSPNSLMALAGLKNILYFAIFTPAKGALGGLRVSLARPSSTTAAA